MYLGAICECTSISSSSTSHKQSCIGSRRYSASRQYAFTIWICRASSWAGAKMAGMVNVRSENRSQSVDCLFKRHSQFYTILFSTTQRFQKLIYLHIFTYCFMKISPQSLGQKQLFLTSKFAYKITLLQYDFIITIHIASIIFHYYYKRQLFYAFTLNLKLIHRIMS